MKNKELLNILMDMPENMDVKVSSLDGENTEIMNIINNNKEILLQLNENSTYINIPYYNLLSIEHRILQKIIPELLLIIKKFPNIFKQFKITQVLSEIEYGDSSIRTQVR